VSVGVGEGVLVVIEKAKAAALVGLAVGRVIVRDDWVRLASLTTKSPATNASVTPKANSPR
jgi:hypothetical protein